MGFKLTRSESYLWPVQFRIPMDGGKFEKIEFKARFRRFSQEELEALMKEVVDNGVSDRAFATRVVCGWDGVTDGPLNEPVEFSEGALDDALNGVALLATAIVKAFQDSLEKAQSGN
jgi:hypothetical protein